jgi:hypothetical protein
MDERIPKAHYNISFYSKFNPNASITLDVLFEKNPYPVIFECAINSRWIKTIEPYTVVNIPDIDSILGDKLTAFAPNTIGVPYFIGETNMSVEIIKQLFDISALINFSTNIENVMKSFHSIANNQLYYRSGNWSIRQILDDIFQTAFLIAKRDRNTGDSDKQRFADLLRGITAFNPFLASGSFRIEDAIRAAGKAAWLSSILATERFETFKKFEEEINVKEIEINNAEYGFLSRLKRTDQEAFYYWYHSLANFNLID